MVDALDSVDELETDLDQTKESMYKLSYVVRVSADSLDELKQIGHIAFLVLMFQA